MDHTLEALFGFANINDVTELPDGKIRLDFQLRLTERDHVVHGRNIEECLEHAARIVRRERMLAEIKRHGLTDEDIDRLTGWDYEEVWQEGYIAGSTDTAHAMREADGSEARMHAEPVISAPASALAGEHIVGPPVDDAEQPMISVDRATLQRLITDDGGMGITLALIHPAKIVLA